LSVASVVGREFDLEVLSRVVASPEEELEAALVEASVAGIIEEGSVVGTTITYQFSHAFFRQTLYDEIVAPRRNRLHQQVARALEDVHRRRLDEHAAELAEQYAFSSDTGDLAKAVHYGEVAARRATEVFAYAEAARQLERALVVQDLVDPEDRARRCDLLLALGQALYASGESEQVIAQVGPDGVADADALGDRRRASRICELVLECYENQGAATSVAKREYLMWAERARLYADPDGTERIRADLALASAWNAQGRLQAARALRLEALTLARQGDDPETLFKSIFLMIVGGAPQHLAERMSLAEEFITWPRAGVSTQTLALVLLYAGRLLLAHGQRARAEDLWRQLAELAERTHVAPVRTLVPACDAILAIVDGHLQNAMTLLRTSVELADEAGASVRARFFTLSILLPPALHLGRADAWLQAFEEFEVLADRASPTLLFDRARAICLAHLGRADEARKLVGPQLDQIAVGSREDETPVFGLLWLLQAAIGIEDRGAAQALTARLSSAAHLSLGEGSYTCVARHLGDGAALVGDRAAARAYYVQALETAGKIRFRPEIALAHLRLAELDLEESDDSVAFEHLNIAIPGLRDMKMHPALERGLILLEQVQHRLAPASGGTASHALTGRERDVARLLAAGRTNREIADALVITEGTVEVHVKHILSKLGLRSRSQVAAWASDERL
jgi:DNA-binding CsgD family transcriptional regulator